MLLELSHLDSPVGRLVIAASESGLHALEFASRHVSLTSLPELAKAVAGRNDDLGGGLAASRDAPWPERLEPVRQCLERAGNATLAGVPLRLKTRPVSAAVRTLRTV